MGNLLIGSQQLYNQGFAYIKGKGMHRKRAVHGLPGKVRWALHPQTIPLFYYRGYSDTWKPFNENVNIQI
jgi:hypothetical protein